MSVTNDPAAMSDLALITGSGAGSIAGMQRLEPLQVATPYGDHGTGLSLVEWQGRQLVHLARHGADHAIAPHLINYRANLWALHYFGVRTIISVGAVGGIHKGLLTPGALAVPDQLIDYTWGRESTFFDCGHRPIEHIDFTEPFTKSIRDLLVSSAQHAGLPCRDGGVYGVTQGPRLETAAEIRRLAGDGCDLVGMTAMPEAALARELGLAYGLLAVVVNAAAGLGSEPIVDEFEQQMGLAVAGALRVVGEAVAAMSASAD